MDYALFDSTGNLIASYAGEREARRALQEITTQHPELAEDVSLIAYDDEGYPTADPVFRIATAVAHKAAAEQLAKDFAHVAVLEWAHADRTTATRADSVEPVG
jgi:hypothetical protein